MKIRHVRFKDGFGAAWLRRCAAVAVSFLAIISIAGTSSLLAVDNLTDHNGIVLTDSNIKLFIVYWGSVWQSGFTDAISSLPSSTYQSYLESFLNSVGGGRWISTQTQYRNASNPQGVIMGKWVDAANTLPSTPNQGQIEEEVRRAAEHFNISSDPQAVYLIALPPGHGDDQFAAKGGGACAWHTRAWNNNIINVRFYPYITLPYMPDAAPGCATNSVNPGFDFSGHGIFDGVSVVAGHEWAETLTDPRIDAWYDEIWNNLNKDGGETGDKCIGKPRNNIGAGGDFFAVQPLWSNNDGGCVLAGVPAADQTPSSKDFGPVVRYSTSSPETVQLTNNGDLDLPMVPIGNSPWYLTGVNTADFSLSGNTCGKILHPSASCQVQVTFRPLVFGTRNATLAVNLSLGFPHTGNATPLTGSGIPQWAVFDNSIIAFGIKPINSGDSAPLPVNLSNLDVPPKLIQQVRLGGPNPSEFSILRDDCTGHELQTSQSCAVVLRFNPNANGDQQAELEITDATGAKVGIPVTGTGLGPVGQLATAVLTFEGIKYNGNGQATPGEIPVSGNALGEVTFTNTGQYGALIVDRTAVTGDFVLDNNGCTQPLQPNDTCRIRVRLRPVRFSLQTGSLFIYDNTGDSPHEVKLTGSVDAPLASLTAELLQFENVPIGNTSGPQMVELENLEGFAPLQIQSITATGDFAAASDCPIQLAIGRCIITVTMKPTAAGPLSGMLLVNDNAPRSPQQIPLAGIGLAGNTTSTTTTTTTSTTTTTTTTTSTTTTTVASSLPPDVGIISIETPAKINPGKTKKVKVVIKNYSNSTQIRNVSLFLNGQNAGAGVLITLEPGQGGSVKFDVLFDTRGTDTLEASLFPGDVNPNNDTKTVTVKVGNKGKDKDKGKDK